MYKSVIQRKYPRRKYKYMNPPEDWEYKYQCLENETEFNLKPVTHTFIIG